VLALGTAARKRWAQEGKMPDDVEGKPGKAGPLVNISADDFFGLGRVADKVMEALKAGIGPVLEPWIRSRLAAADQQAARGWLEVTKDSGLAIREMEIETLSGRAQIRVRAEQVEQQENREAVAVHTLREIADLSKTHSIETDPDPVEPEWLNRFWRLAQDVTSEDLQSVWGRVLARKATGAGAISARTLEGLSLLDGWEIEELTRIAPCVISTTRHGITSMELITKFSAANVSENDYEPINRRLGELINKFDRVHFGGIGLLDVSGFFQFNFMVSNGQPLALGGRRKIISVGSETPIVAGSAAIFSRTGEEILGLIKSEPNEDYVRVVLDGLGRQGISVKPAD
jgi:hypothetical protein